MSVLIMDKPSCPVCGMEVLVLSDPERFHCGNVRLLLKEGDHYLTFSKEVTEWPKKGCPICGRPMKNAGRFQPLRLLASEPGIGFERMFCDQPDHYCYVTKPWYDKNRR